MISEAFYINLELVQSNNAKLMIHEVTNGFLRKLNILNDGTHATRF